MKSCFLLAVLIGLCLPLAVRAQTYTNDQLVSGPSALPWRTQFDPIGRISLGSDDGNATASPHASAWASVARFGGYGTEGAGGLLYDFTVTSEGAPTAFGLARSGCVASDAASTHNCLLIRWQSVRHFVTGDLEMQAIVVFPGFTTLHTELNVQTGDSFSIERVGTGQINFYRSTGIQGERRMVHSISVSPFAGDGNPPNASIEARAVFAPDSATRKISASEIYYCAPWSGCF